MTVEGNFFNSTTNLHMEQYLRNDDAPTTAPHLWRHVCASR